MLRKEEKRTLWKLWKGHAFVWQMLSQEVFFRAIFPNLILNILGKRMAHRCFYRVFPHLRHYKDNIKYTFKIFHESQL